MHMLWFVGVALMAVAVTQALPVSVDTNNSTETLNKSTTHDALKEFFRPTNDYLFNKLPVKTPSEVAKDINEKMTNVKQSIEEMLPVTIDTNNSTETLNKSTTHDALKEFFRPTNDYLFNKLPSKTPSEVAKDINEKMTNVKQSIEETEAMKRLASSLAPVKTWFKEKVTTMHEKVSALKDTTFQQMYDHIKERVTSLNHKIGTWIKEHTPRL